MYEPTYKIEPVEKLRTQGIFKKCKNTLTKLLKKNDKYDPTYSPKFVKIACEIIKNDVKNFSLDRYKILVHISILQKVNSQSCLIVSSCLWTESTDKRICIRLDTETFYLLCYVFLIYHE